MPRAWLSERLVREIPLEEPVMVSKNQKLAEIIRIMQKRRIDRVLITSYDMPVGLVTVKDILFKLGSRRMRAMSSASLSVSGLSSGKLITTKPDEDLLKAAQRLKEGISSLPVIGDDGRTYGLLTKMGLVLFLGSRHKADVQEVMQSYAGTIDVSTKLSQALTHIRSSPIRELLVVDNLRPVAVVGEREVALALFNLLSTSFIRHAEVVLKRSLVSDVMRRIKTSLTPQSDLKIAISLLSSEMINTIPVMQEGKVVGLVTRDRIFEYLLRREELQS